MQNKTFGFSFLIIMIYCFSLFYIIKKYIYIWVLDCCLDKTSTLQTSFWALGPCDGHFSHFFNTKITDKFINTKNNSLVQFQMQMLQLFFLKSRVIYVMLLDWILILFWIITKLCGRFIFSFISCGTDLSHLQDLNMSILLFAVMM